MRPRHLIPLLLLTACGRADHHAVLRSLHEGNTLYQQGRWVEADSIYSSAPDHGTLSFNRAHARFRQGDLDSAIALGIEADQLLDSARWKANARYDMGNAYLLLAMQADSLAVLMNKELSELRVDGEDVTTRLRQYVLRDSLQRLVKRTDHLIDSALAQGTEAYRNALRLEPGSEDARHNLMIGLRKIAARPKPDPAKNKGDSKKDEQIAITEKAKALLAQADELVNRHEFQAAFDLLQNGLKQEPTLGQRKDYMDKLGLITSILRTP
jgi:tetratricopeptide (TPR) repeat protein